MLQWLFRWPSSYRVPHGFVTHTCPKFKLAVLGIVDMSSDYHGSRTNGSGYSINWWKAVKPKIAVIYYFNGISCWHAFKWEGVVYTSGMVLS